MRRDDHDPKVVGIQLENMTRCLRPVSAAEATHQATESAALRRLQRRHHRSLRTTFALREAEYQSEALQRMLHQDFLKSTEDHASFLTRFRQRNLALDQKFKEKGIHLVSATT